MMPLEVILDINSDCPIALLKIAIACCSKLLFITRILDEIYDNHNFIFVKGKYYGIRK